MRGKKQKTHLTRKDKKHPVCDYTEDECRSERRRTGSDLPWRREEFMQPHHRQEDCLCDLLRKEG